MEGRYSATKPTLTSTSTSVSQRHDMFQLQSPLGSSSFSTSNMVLNGESRHRFDVDDFIWNIQLQFNAEYAAFVVGHDANLVLIVCGVDKKNVIFCKLDLGAKQIICNGIYRIIDYFTLYSKKLMICKG